MEPTINHFESDTPCYRVAHDGEQVVSVTHGVGKTSSMHELITGEAWEDITDQLAALEIQLGETFIPQEDEA